MKILILIVVLLGIFFATGEAKEQPTTPEGVSIGEPDNLLRIIRIGDKIIVRRMPAVSPEAELERFREIARKKTEEIRMRDAINIDQR